MKKIEAIIRKTRFEDLKAALLDSDINWFEYHDVHGIGQARQERIYRGVQYSTDVIERVHLSIVCREQFVEPTLFSRRSTGSSVCAVGCVKKRKGLMSMNMESPAITDDFRGFQVIRFN